MFHKQTVNLPDPSGEIISNSKVSIKLAIVLSQKKTYRSPWMSLSPACFIGGVWVICQVPRCTFTHPEVATVGLTLSEALQQLGSQVSAKLRHLEQVDRAICEGGTWTWAGSSEPKNVRFFMGFFLEILWRYFGGTLMEFNGIFPEA